MVIPKEAYTREEQYLSAMAAQEGPVPPKPITRKEMFYAKAIGQNVSTPVPITREEQYLDAIAKGGGGGPSITVEPLTVSENGVYTPSSGQAYGPVTVSIPKAEGEEF